jgi:histone H3/H4
LEINKKRIKMEDKDTNKTKGDVSLIIKSNIRLAVDLSVATEVEPALNKLVNDTLRKAEQRALANGRRTVQARDL